MATKVDDRSQRDRQRPGRPNLGPGHDTPSGDASDPRGENTVAGSSADPRGENTAAGDASDPRGELRDAEQQGGAGGGDTGSYSSGDINDQEQSSGQDSFYNSGGGKSSKKGTAKGFLKRHKKKLIPGAGIFGGGLIAIIFTLFSLIPLKIEHIVSNLQDHFFASSEQATENATQKMLKTYVKHHVLKAYKGCGTTRSSKCKVRIISPGTNPVSNLYRSWADVRLENTLATKYNIEFKRVGVGGGQRWHLIAPGTGAKGDDIGANGEGIDREFQRADRASMRAAINKSMQDETKWKRVMYRYKVGRLLEQKYGIKRCLVFCGVRDTFAEKKEKRVLAAQIFLTQRVLIPRTESFGIVLECLLSPDCHPNETQPTSGDASVAEAGGAPENADVDGKTRTTLTALAAHYGLTDAASVEKMIKDYEDISNGNGGFSKFFLDKALEKLGKQELSEPINKLGPVVSGTVLVAKVITALNGADGKVRKLTYVTNSAAAVAMWSTFRSYGDEIHTGNVDATEVGSFVDSLGPGNLGNPNDPEVGGTATAEDTPLYDNILGHGSSAPSNTRAYAKDYKCKGDKPVPGNKLVCGEEVLGQGNATLGAINDFLNSPVVAPLTAVAGVITDLAHALSSIIANIPGVSQVGSLLTSLVTSIPGVSDITKFLSSTIGSLVKDVIPNPFGSNMSGGRSFDMAAAGANVAGNDSCSQIGCQAVSAAAVAEILQQQQTESRQQFAEQPFFARMFSTESQYSLVSKLAMAAPLNLRTSAVTGFTGLMSNPLGVFASSFGNIFSGQRVSAVTPRSVNPFRVGTVAFPNNKIPDDAESYWDAHHCDDTSANGPIAKWQADAADPSGDKHNENPDTGMPVHRNVSPCLLIQHSTGNAGAIYDSSLLSDDDKADIGGGAAAAGAATAPPAAGTATPGTLPTGTAKTLAGQLKTFVDSGKIKCLNAGCPDIVDTANGTSIKKASCFVDAMDPAILGMLLKLVQDGHTFILSAMCTDHPTNPASLHHQGKGVDFNTIDGTFMGPNANQAWSAPKIAAAEKLDQDIAAFMPKSTGFGQNGSSATQIACHAPFATLSGFNQFPDGCHHQHVQVP